MSRHRQQAGRPGAGGLLWLCLTVITACDYPELAQAPSGSTGPPPDLAPLGPLLVETASPDPEADAALEARAAALRARAANVPTDPIEPETRAAMEAIRPP